MKSLAIVITLVTLLASCHQPATAQTDAAAMKAYKKQKFRFEVRDCRLFYNEQQVVLDSMETFERIFGKNYISPASADLQSVLPTTHPNTLKHNLFT